MTLLRRFFLLLLLICLYYGAVHAWTTPNKFRDGDYLAKVASRREILPFVAAAPLLLVDATVAPANAYSGPQIDVNNAMAREFTAFPGLYPTIATKIVNGAKNSPYKSKKEVYAVLDSDLERERLKQYDGALVISKPNAALKQFKASQICKYECGSRVSSSYRDEQIKSVQAARDGR